MGNVNWKTDEYQKSGFDPIPKGRYLCLVDNSSMEDTKNKTGKYLEFTFTVMRGTEGEKYKNRKLWARLNVHNPSAEAQRIGREQFNALADACGRPNPGDSSELHNKLVVLIVDIEDGQQGPQNRVTGYLKPSDSDRNVSRPSARPQESTGASQQQQGSEQKKPAGKFDDMDDDIPF